MVIKINCLGSKTERTCRRKIPSKEGTKNGKENKNRIKKALGTSVATWARKSKIIFSPDSWFSKWTPAGFGANMANGLRLWFLWIISSESIYPILVKVEVKVKTTRG